MLATWRFLAVSERHTTMRLASSNSTRAAEDCRQDGPFTKPRRVFRLQPIIFTHLLISKGDIKYPIFCLHPLLSLPQPCDANPTLAQQLIGKILETNCTTFTNSSPTVSIHCTAIESQVAWRSSSSCPNSGCQLRHCFYSPLLLEDGLGNGGWRSG